MRAFFRPCAAAAALCAALAFAVPAAAAPHPARAVVEGFHDVLLEVMKGAESLGIKGRYTRLAPELERRFQIRLMAAITSSRYWRRATKEQRARLAAAFERFSVATYAARFASYSGESFETVSVTPGPRGTMLVRTRINRPGDSPVRLTYVTRRFADSWRIVDVLVDDGISELAVRRSEYRGVLAKRGIDGLIAVLNEKADKLLTQ